MDNIFENLPLCYSYLLYAYYFLFAGSSYHVRIICTSSLQRWRMLLKQSSVHFSPKKKAYLLLLHTRKERKHHQKYYCYWKEELRLKKHNKIHIIKWVIETKLIDFEIIKDAPLDNSSSPFYKVHIRVVKIRVPFGSLLFF